MGRLLFLFELLFKSNLQMLVVLYHGALWFITKCKSLTCHCTPSAMNWPSFTCRRLQVNFHLEIHQRPSTFKSIYCIMCHKDSIVTVYAHRILFLSVCTELGKKGLTIFCFIFLEYIWSRIAIVQFDPSRTFYIHVKENGIIISPCRYYFLFVQFKFCSLLNAKIMFYDCCIILCNLCSVHSTFI